MLDRLTSDIVDGVLVLDVTGPRFGFDLGEIDYALTVPRLSAVTVQGSSDVTADFSEADDVAVEIDGSGDVEGSGIDASEVTVTISGSGDVTLANIALVVGIQVGSPSPVKDLLQERGTWVFDAVVGQVLDVVGQREAQPVTSATADGRSHLTAEEAP